MKLRIAILCDLVSFSRFCSIAAVTEKPEAFVWCEVVEGLAEEGPETFHGAG